MHPSWIDSRGTFRSRDVDRLPKRPRGPWTFLLVGLVLELIAGLLAVASIGGEDDTGQVRGTSVVGEFFAGAVGTVGVVLVAVAVIAWGVRLGLRIWHQESATR